MSKPLIYIDGQEGTTGLKILERFGDRNDIELLTISEELRKDTAERKRLINMADYVFLCLPDAAAIEAVSLLENDRTRIIDASTAHRTNPDWAYGFPELSREHYNRIKDSKRVAVPGCYASGFASIIYPLVKSGVMPADYPVTAFASSGYSGGGKKMIAQYEAENRDGQLDSTRFYALGMLHKHLPEMQYVSGLEYTPAFTPFVGDYFNGMAFFVPLHTRLLGGSVNVQSLRGFFEEYYSGCGRISVLGADDAADGFIASNTLANSDNMQIFVMGSDDRPLICSRFDNLGKGASGAAVQCLDIMLS